MQVLRKVNLNTDRFPFAAPDYVEGGELAAARLGFNSYERANIDRIVAVERAKGCR